MTSEQRKDRYAYMVRQNKCQACGTKDSRTLSGYVYCAKCSEYYREKNRLPRLTRQEVLADYERMAQEIRDDMPAHEKMGAGRYYRHKLAMIEEFVRKLRRMEG